MPPGMTPTWRKSLLSSPSKRINASRPEFRIELHPRMLQALDTPCVLVRRPWGRTLPIKFQLTDYNGAVSSLSAVTSLQVLDYWGNNVLPNAGSTALRYDSTSKQFVANWQTKGLATGTYTVVLSLADGTTYTRTL